VPRLFHRCASLPSSKGAENVSLMRSPNGGHVGGTSITAPASGFELTNSECAGSSARLGKGDDEGGGEGADPATVPIGDNRGTERNELL
jgi:hypothetical protein